MLPKQRQGLSLIRLRTVLNPHDRTPGHHRKCGVPLQPNHHWPILAGVQPSDSEEPINRGRRDKPRIIFQPIHAVIAMLTLTCALCASLTMLIQQATHYAQLQSTQPTVRQTAHPSSGASPSASASSAQSDTAQSESTDTDPTSDLLDLNTAGLEELQTLKGIGPVTAQRILDYRMQFGRFDNVDQLMDVKGIGSKTLAKFRDQVCVR